MGALQGVSDSSSSSSSSALSSDTVKAYLDGVYIEFKEGALRRQMKLKPTEKFTRSELTQIAALSTGRRFRIFGREYKATALLKKRAALGAALMKK